VQIEETDTLDSLEAKIHALEHVLYPQAIQLWVDKKLRCEGRKVRIT
jgi:phosphoribosylglycinamide formyltransferase 1